MEEDTTENFVDESSGKSNAEALREFWRTHSVTMGKKDWTRDDLYKRREAPGPAPEDKRAIQQAATIGNGSV